MEQKISLELNPVASRQTPRWKSLEFVSTATSDSSSRGSAASSVYLLQPVMWLRAAIDAAKERQMFAQAAAEKTLPEGNKDFVWPKRKLYLGRGSWESSSAEYAVDSNISSTQINTNDGVQFVS